jgi:hypothetical protein
MSLGPLRADMPAAHPFTAIPDGNLGFHNTAKGDVHYWDVHYWLEKASDDRYPESEAGT